MKSPDQWVFQAGEPVFSREGRRIGTIVAVKRDAVLVEGETGVSVWTPRRNVMAFDDTGITLAETPSELDLRDGGFEPRASAGGGRAGYHTPRPQRKSDFQA